MLQTVYNAEGCMMLMLETFLEREGDSSFSAHKRSYAEAAGASCT